MDMTTKSCREFVTVLASNEPAPGGGGASALVAALGTALGNMVGALTVGKKKYEDVEEEIKALMKECDDLQTQLLDQVPADAEGFVPLAKAYGIPKDDPTRAETLEKATIIACAVIVKSALQAASLNVFINTKTLANRAVAEEMNAKCLGMLDTYGKLADEIFETVKAGFFK